MLRDLNTEFRGQYLFGGAAGTIQPYSKDGAGVVSSYQASTLEVSVDVDTEHAVAIAFNGESLARGAAADDLFVVMQNAIAAARAGDEPGLGTALDGLQQALDRATTFQARLGSSLKTIEDDRVRLAESARSSKGRISALEDTNMADAITGMTQAETTYRAALGAASQMHKLSLMDYLK
jgi:flagellin-like hook-associated protein FlgL